MADSKRVFILGAGFSKPAGMPLATEVLPLLLERIQVDEMRQWLDGLRELLAWFSASDGEPDSFAMNIEQVFHDAHFDIEALRLRQQLAQVGRADGPGTPWKCAESVKAWLSYLEDALRDVILQREDAADLTPINRWAEAVGERDTVLTFNYDTLVERALDESNKSWNHGFECEGDNGIRVFKLHGSIDWIVADRDEPFSKLDLLFDKQNASRTQGKTGHVEDDCCLWRSRSPEQLSTWIKGRDLQQNAPGATPRSVGIAGLGAYKELHRVPGLGRTWVHGMQALNQADLAVVVGFSMSDFDAMAQMQFARVARSRWREGRPLCVVVIDPYIDDAGKDRFRRVFRFVEFVRQDHQTFDWTPGTGQA